LREQNGKKFLILAENFAFSIDKWGKIWYSNVWQKIIK
jgi:hypothetical protein